MYYNKNPKPHKKLDRRHYNYRGKVKVQYKTKEAAEEVLKHYDHHYVAYLCPVCNMWHIGYVKDK